MLSAHKTALFIASAVALVGSVATVGLAAAVHVGLVVPQAVRPLFGPLLASVALAFVPAVVLQIEYAQALRGAQFKLLTEESLSFSQFLQSLRWCPWPVALVSLLLAALGFVLEFALGMPRWSSGEPLTLHAARGVLLFHAPFFLLALPIVISGLCVPESFAAQVGPGKVLRSGTNPSLQRTLRDKAARRR